MSACVDDDHDLLRGLVEIPLSVTTVDSGPYADHMGPAGLRYSYRGTDPTHPDIRGLHTAMTLQLPLVYFLGVGAGKYLATWPVFVVADDPAGLAVTVAVDAAEYGLRVLQPGDTDATPTEADTVRRQYVTAQVRQRLHQRRFRERALDAYRRQCALCRLRHEHLLDAAHIVPDTAPEGEPVVQNGLALCKLHHAAFESLFVGVRPDYVIVARPDILAETDGPTLRHAIRGLNGQVIDLPRRMEQRPAVRQLEARAPGLPPTWGPTALHMVRLSNIVVLPPQPDPQLRLFGGAADLPIESVTTRPLTASARPSSSGPESQHYVSAIPGEPPPEHASKTVLQDADSGPPASRRRAVPCRT